MIRVFTCVPPNPSLSRFVTSGASGTIFYKARMREAGKLKE